MTKSGIINQRTPVRERYNYPFKGKNVYSTPEESLGPEKIIAMQEQALRTKNGISIISLCCPYGNDTNTGGGASFQFMPFLDKTAKSIIESSPQRIPSIQQLPKEAGGELLKQVIELGSRFNKYYTGFNSMEASYPIMLLQGLEQTRPGNQSFMHLHYHLVPHNPNIEHFRWKPTEEVSPSHRLIIHGDKTSKLWAKYLAEKIQINSLSHEEQNREIRKYNDLNLHIPKGIATNIEATNTGLKVTLNKSLEEYKNNTEHLFSKLLQPIYNLAFDYNNLITQSIFENKPNLHKLISEFYESTNPSLTIEEYRRSGKTLKLANNQKIKQQAKSLNIPKNLIQSFIPSINNLREAHLGNPKEISKELMRQKGIFQPGIPLIMSLQENELQIVPVLFKGPGGLVESTEKVLLYRNQEKPPEKLTEERDIFIREIQGSIY